jgi:hypothetical protein
MPVKAASPYFLLFFISNSKAFFYSAKKTVDKPTAKKESRLGRRGRFVVEKSLSVGL